MSRPRAIWSAAIAGTVAITGVGLVAIALEPAPITSVESETIHGSAELQNAVISNPAQSSRPSTPISSIASAPSPTVDTHLVDAVLAPDAPEDGVPAVFVASAEAVADPAFQKVAKTLTKLGDDLYTGNVTAKDLLSLTDLTGVQVAQDHEINLDPRIEASGLDWDPVWDTAVTLNDLYPNLDSLRSTFNVDGTDQTIAIVDSGVDTKALGLGSGKVIYRKDFSTKTKKCKDGSYLDPLGHGTHVASIAAGTATSGIQGVAPGSKIVDLRVFNCAGDASTANVLNALKWIINDKQGADNYGITIVNLSLSSTSEANQNGTDQISKLVNQMVALGIFVSVSAGNEGNLPDTVFTPGTAAHATTVGAANRTPQYGTFLAPYSSVGATVDLVAPGSSIIAARSTKLGTTTKTIAMSGTSMAAPLVAGVAALILHRDPDARPQGLVINDADPTGVSGVGTNGVENAFKLSDWFAAGHDDATGLGLLDVEATLSGDAAEPAQVTSFTTTAPPATSPRDWWLRVPPRAHGVTISLLLSGSLPEEHLSYLLLDHTGNTISNWTPCDLNQTTSTTDCSVFPHYDATNGRYFHIPPSTESTYLLLRTPYLRTLSFTAHGLAEHLEPYRGIYIQGGESELDLSTALSGYARVGRATDSPAEELTLSVVSSSPHLAITFPNGQQLAASTTGSLRIDVSRTSDFASDVSARIAVKLNDYLAGIISVRLPGNAGDSNGAEGQIYQARERTAKQLIAGEPVDFPIFVTDGLDDSGRSGHLFASRRVSGASGSASPSYLLNSSGSGFWRAEDDSLLPFSSFANFLLYDVSPNANGPMAIDGSHGSLVGVHGYGVPSDQVFTDGDWYALRRTREPYTIPVPYEPPTLTLSLYGELYEELVELGYEGPTFSTIPLDGWGSPVLSADGSYVAYSKYVLSGYSIKQVLHWASLDLGQSSIKRVSGLLSANDYVRVIGVTDKQVVVERMAKHNSTTAELRVYNVATKKYSKVATVIPGTTTASTDGTSYGYIKAKTNSAYCYSTAAKKNYSVGTFGTVLEGTQATGDGCSWVIGTFMNTPELPANSVASQLAKLIRGGSAEVLATSAPMWDTFRWVVSRGGANFATATAVSLAAGDTNGRDDVYVGLHGSPPLTVTGDILLSADHPAPGRSASVVAPPWNEGAETRYQWYRGSSPIAGATGSTYTFTSKDVGKTLRVQVSGTKNGYAPTVLWSESTTKVLKAFKSGKTTLTGTIDSGKKLTVKVHGWAPSKTMYTYQWMRDGAPIVGATGKSYTLTPDDAGTTLTALVYPTRSGYAYTEVTSTPRVINELFDASPHPVIISDPVVGTTLSVDTTGWNPEPTKFTYQWKRDGKSISKATKSTYTLTSSSAGKKITVTVKATLAGHTTTSRTSAIHQIERIFTTAPKPTISGAAEVGTTLTAKTGAWKATPDSFDYQWNRNGAPIAGATASSYELVGDDEATKITVTVTANRAGYTSKSTTSASKTVKNVLTSIPALSYSGTVEFNTTQIATVGETISVTFGAWEPAPVTLKYQWKRDGKSISKATKQSYKPTSSDLGNQLSVTVTATKSGYSTVVLTSTPLEALPVVPVPDELHFLINGNPGDPATLTTGGTVELLTDNWTPPGGAFIIAWTSGGIVVHTGTSYTVQASDIAAAIEARVELDGYRPAFATVRNGNVG